MADQLTFEPEDLEKQVQEVLADVPRPQEQRELLEDKYANLIRTNKWLDRTLVSFQANKELPFFRWFKYREGFAAPMVQKVLTTLFPNAGDLLDPFAGAGAALFSAREIGWQTQGIELLPSAQFGIKSRLAAEQANAEEFRAAVHRVKTEGWAEQFATAQEFQHIPITAGAFPPETEQKLNAYLRFVRTEPFGAQIKQLLEFAAYCTLEDISYTRKDGQYLRWDYRSGRQLGQRQFDKGEILPFRLALMMQLEMMQIDLLQENRGGLFAENQTLVEQQGPPPRLIEGSCLEQLPLLADSSFDCVFTSPPYCNRYDYTRTYALELAFLGAGEEEVKNLRQQMLFCTVENRKKDLKGQFAAGALQSATDAFNNQAALQEVLGIIDHLRDLKRLNNTGIAKLVRNYFFELNLVIRECSRVLRQGGYFVMVNDNVRYAGEAVPVDTIMSEFAEAAGLQTVHIWKLGRGKGNSSQQMGAHGRTELRKSICVWQKQG